MSFHRKLAGLVIGGLLSVAGAVHAQEIVVVGNKANGQDVDKAFVVKAFTGEVKAWSDGTPLVLIDQGEDNALRNDFYTKTVGKSASNVKALWAQLIFSGRALPPKVIDGDAEVKKAVAANKGAIAYIKASSVDDTVKVLQK